MGLEYREITVAGRDNAGERENDVGVLLEKRSSYIIGGRYGSIQTDVGHLFGVQYL